MVEHLLCKCKALSSNPNKKTHRLQWLISVIPTIWEVETGGISIQGQH
jgi:hypothetical protein